MGMRKDKEGVWIIQEDVRKETEAPKETRAHVVLGTDSVDSAARARTVLGTGSDRRVGRAQTSRRHAKKRQSRKLIRPVRLLLGIYGFGCAHPLLHKRRLSNFIWAALGLVGLVSCLYLLLSPNAFPDANSTKHLTISFLLALSLAAGILALLAWVRAVLALGRDPRLQPGALPNWLRRPSYIALAGLLLPGFGLLAFRHPRRASLAGICAGHAVYGLAMIGLLRRLSMRQSLAGINTSFSGFMEAWLAITIGMAVIGVLFWVGSALDGARLACMSTRQARSIAPDRYGLALLTAIVLFNLGFQPVSVAGELDGLALHLEQVGFSHLPFYLELAALRLDPSRPEYALQAADRGDTLGRHTWAAALRYEVRERWQNCAAQLTRPSILPVRQDTIPMTAETGSRLISI